MKIETQELRRFAQLKRMMASKYPKRVWEIGENTHYLDRDEIKNLTKKRLLKNRKVKHLYT